MKKKGNKSQGLELVILGIYGKNIFKFVFLFRFHDLECMFGVSAKYYGTLFDVLL